MVSDETEDIVRALAKKGFSERRIAREVNISRKTVSNILARKPRGELNQQLVKHPQRCPRCNYLVILPCVVCGYRKPRYRVKLPYVDNLYISLVCKFTADFEPHTLDKEDRWDDEYVRTHPWFLEKESPGNNST